MDQGITQAELGARLAVDESAINTWDRRRTAPEIHHYPKIIQLLGHSP